MEALEAARMVVERRFPECSTAFLAGSLVRGEATATSDLDIVVITRREEAPFRESLMEADWPAEVFVHTPESLRQFMATNAQRRIPTLMMMCAEGIILRDREGLAEDIKREARRWLAQGPEPLTAAQMDHARYRVTDLLDDFLGSERFEESLFIANDLAAHAADLILAQRRQWSGQGKWLLRALRRFDPQRADQLTAALQRFYQAGDKTDLTRFAEAALAPVGGRLFAGFRASGKPGDAQR
ncbi:MAG TPA: nucleotidyltransferase domain-containing protein [Chthonomonadaceae bacterium]|nr:nucleotidyltransferase domain-containing protein [Chthonomonadaceae bacterium]